MTPLDIVQQTSPVINDAGGRFYSDPDTLAVGKELGLGGFRFYFLGRGGVLGNVEPAVIVAAFGYFSPAVVETMWSSACQIMDPREAARAQLTCADRFGIGKLDGLDVLDGFNDAAEALIAGVDRAALPLFAGLAAEPLPDHRAARAYRNICILRELRGSVHLLAVVATGISPSVAHAIRRPDAVAMFGWDPAPEASDDDRGRLAVADELTDRLLVAPVESLDESQRDAFVTGVEIIGAHVLQG